MGNTRPLENLAAFAICFALGALSTLCMSTYAGKLKRDTHKMQATF